MAEKYVPVFDDWVEVTKELNDQEKGRLIDAMVLYRRGGDWQERIKGNERYLFPAFQRQIDRMSEISEARSIAGATGGKQTQAKSSKTSKEEEYKEDINKEYLKENIKEKSVRHKFGQYLNVLLTDEDLDKLKAEFPQDYNDRIERLSAYIAQSGKSYKNHLATIRNWARRDSGADNKRDDRKDAESRWNLKY